MVKIRKQLPVPEMDGDPDNERIWCAWADCDNPASGLTTMVECFASAPYRNHPELPGRPQCAECRRVAFCCEQHRSYYLRSHRPGQYGRLAPGLNPVYR